MLKVDFHELFLPVTLTEKIYTCNAELEVHDYRLGKDGKNYFGSGEINFFNGNKFVGDVFHGMLHGKGTFTWTSGVVYSGEFSENCPHGKGKYSWPDGSTYEGEIYKGFRHGKGSFSSCDNEVCYEGDWQMGIRHGKGYLKYSTKAEYIGDFVQGKKQGKGKFTYPSGNYYEGEWENDKKNGVGTMVWVTTMEKYVGTWKDNLQHGLGTHYWLVETYSELVLMFNRYEGQWERGKRNGLGAFCYSNGSKYEGEWMDNLKHGLGKYTDESTMFYYAVYNENRIHETLLGLPIQFNLDYRIKASAMVPPDFGGLNMPGMKTELSLLDQESAKKPGLSARPSARVQSAAPGKPNRSPNLVGSKLRKTENKDMIVEEIRQVETEKNPYLTLISIQKIAQARYPQEEVEKYQKELNFVYKVLVRHNSTLKLAYHHLRGVKECHTEDIFVPRLGVVWEYFMKMGCFEPECGLAAVNRLFFAEDYNHFEERFDPVSFVKKARELGFELKHNTVNTNVKEKAKSEVVYDPTGMVFFKSFVDFILRIVTMKAKSCKDLSNALQEFILRNFLEGEEIDQDLDLVFLKEIPQEIRQLFYLLGNPRYRSKFERVEETAFIRDLIVLLKKKSAFFEEPFVRSLSSIWAQKDGTKKLTREMVNYEFTIHEFFVFFPIYSKKISIKIEGLFEKESMPSEASDPLINIQKKVSIEDFQEYLLPKIMENEKNNQ